MRTWLFLSLSLLLLALCLLACGPSSEGKGLGRRGATTGMCPNCGATNLDVESTTERSPHNGSPTEYLTITCRDCGNSWRAPGGTQ